MKKEETEKCLLFVAGLLLEGTVSCTHRTASSLTLTSLADAQDLNEMKVVLPAVKLAPAALLALWGAPAGERTWEKAKSLWEDPKALCEELLPFLMNSIREGTMPSSNVDEAREYTTQPGFSCAWMVTRSEHNHRQHFSNSRPSYPRPRLGDVVLALLQLHECISHASPQKPPPRDDAEKETAEAMALASELSPEQVTDPPLVL